MVCVDVLYIKFLWALATIGNGVGTSNPLRLCLIRRHLVGVEEAL